MSAETKAALDDAIAAHVADEMDAALTGYVLHASSIQLDGERGRTCYLAEYADSQPFHVTLGLAYLLVRRLDADSLNDVDD